MRFYFTHIHTHTHTHTHTQNAAQNIFYNKLFLRKAEVGLYIFCIFFTCICDKIMTIAYCYVYIK